MTGKLRPSLTLTVLEVVGAQLAMGYSEKQILDALIFLPGEEAAPVIPPGVRFERKADPFPEMDQSDILRPVVEEHVNARHRTREAQIEREIASLMKATGMTLGQAIARVKALSAIKGSDGSR